MTSEKDKLSLILALAFALRIMGIGFGLPHLYHQDEPILVNHALAMGAGGLNPHFFILPPFVMYLLLLVYGVFFAVGWIFNTFQGSADFAFLFVKDPSSFYWLGRLFAGVLPGTATVWALWSGTKRFFGAKAAHWAALLLALMPVHVQHSHYIYADIFLTLAVTLMFFALLAAAEDPSGRNYARFGALAGWGAAVKYTALYFTPALLAAHFAAHSKNGFKADNLIKAAFSGACCIAVFLLLAPFSLLDWTHFWAGVSGQSNALWNLFQVPWWFHLQYSIIGGSGIIFMILSAAGLLMLLRSSPKHGAVTTAFLLSYYGLNLYPGTQSFARYMLPLMPVFALLASLCLTELARKRRILSLVLGAAVCIKFLLPAVYSDFLFLVKDTRTECLQWFERSVEPGAVVAVDSRFFGPRLTQSEELLQEKYAELEDKTAPSSQKTRLDLMIRAAAGKRSYKVYLLSTAEQQAGSTFLFNKPFVAPDRSELQRIGAQYLVRNYSDRVVNAGDPKDRLNRFFEESAGRMERVAFFSPYRDASKRIPADHDNTALPHLSGELFSRRSAGPYLEVYRIKDGA